MDNVGFWKILRVLTTNACNYKCVFCHNEGQEKFDGLHSNMMKAKDLKQIVDSLKDSGLQEIQFSGGEPFMNPETIDMIEWVNDNTDLEIGCATNTQFFNDQVIERLSRTRVGLHIQFPSNNQKKFEKITRTDLFTNLLSNLERLKQNNISFSLNYVLLTPSIDDFKEILPFLFEHNVGLKLLPFINNNTLKYNDFKREIIPFLDSISYQFENQKNGSLKWWVLTPSQQTITIKYIDSPCFDYDFDTCKNYGEIRLLPDLTLQSCLINSSGNLKIDFDLMEESSSQLVNQLFHKAWKNFTHC